MDIVAHHFLWHFSPLARHIGLVARKHNWNFLSIHPFGPREWGFILLVNWVNNVTQSAGFVAALERSKFKQNEKRQCPTLFANWLAHEEVY